MRTNNITIRGLVATSPKLDQLSNGDYLLQMRVASRVDTGPNDQDFYNNWFSVTATGSLAKNVNDSVQKGSLIMVTGNLKVRDWDNHGRSGTVMEVVADAIAIDITKPLTVSESVKPHNCDCNRCKIGKN